jgi:hypothetical protein
LVIFPPDRLFLCLIFPNRVVILLGRGAITCSVFR